MAKKRNKKKQARSRGRRGVNPPNAGNPNNYISQSNNPTSSAPPSNPTASFFGQMGAIRHPKTPSSGMAAAKARGSAAGKSAVARLLGKTPHTGTPDGGGSIADIFGQMGDLGGISGDMGNPDMLGNPAKYEDANRGHLSLEQYYPHYMENPVVSHVQGSMIGTQPIFVESGYLAPIGMLHARKKVLTDAAKEAYYRQKKVQEPPEKTPFPDAAWEETHGAYEGDINQAYYEKYKEIYMRHGGDGASAKFEIEECGRALKADAALIDEVAERVQKIEDLPAGSFKPQATMDMVWDFYNNIDEFIAASHDEKQKMFQRFGYGAKLPTLYADHMKQYVDKDIATKLGIETLDGVDKKLLAKTTSSYLTPPKRKWLVDTFMQNNKAELTGHGGVYAGKKPAYVREQVEKDIANFYKANLGITWTQVSDGGDGGGGGKDTPTLYRSIYESKQQITDLVKYAGNESNLRSGLLDENNDITFPDGTVAQIFSLEVDDLGGMQLDIGLGATDKEWRTFTGEEIGKLMDSDINRDDFDGIDRDAVPMGASMEGKHMGSNIGFVKVKDGKVGKNLLSVAQVGTTNDSDMRMVAVSEYRFGLAAEKAAAFAKDLARVREERKDGTKIQDIDFGDDQFAEALLKFQVLSDNEMITGVDDNGFTVRFLRDMHNPAVVAELDNQIDDSYHKKLFRKRPKAGEGGVVFDETGGGGK